MGILTFAAAVDINLHDCPSCGTLFGVTAELEKRRRNDHRAFYCPNGHDLYFKGQTAAEKERDEAKQKAAELEREKRILERQLTEARQNEEIELRARKAAERKYRGQKGATTRIKNRVARGMCPCCSRRFKDLGAHMKADHPKWDPDRHAAAIAAETAAQEPAGATIEGAANG